MPPRYNTPQNNPQATNQFNLILTLVTYSPDTSDLSLIFSLIITIHRRPRARDPFVDILSESWMRRRYTFEEFTTEELRFIRILAPQRLNSIRTDDWQQEESLSTVYEPSETLQMLRFNHLLDRLVEGGWSFHHFNQQTFDNQWGLVPRGERAIVAKDFWKPKQSQQAEPTIVIKAPYKQELKSSLAAFWYKVKPAEAQQSDPVSQHKIKISL